MKNVLEKISNRVIGVDETIINAMKKMDKEGVKLLFVFENDRFLGILTIGDIQRAIIRNVDMNTAVRAILDKKKIYAKVSDSLDIIK